MQQFLSTEAVFIGLLLVAALVAIVVRRLQVPYTVALVLAGLLLATLSPTKFALTPELILALFVPPLIFEAAFHLNISDLRQSFPAILTLAVPGVILTMFIVAGAVVAGARIALPVALVFGALIAATDPVAVVSLFRQLGVPKKLSVLVEGESLFNDGTALVLFQLMLGIALTGKFNLVQSIADFLRVSAGGVLLGLLLGWLASRVIERIDDYLIETTITTVLAYGAYLVAEQLHFSGVLAVVAAGLINGNLGPQGMSPTTRIVLYNFWEYTAFLVNSLVFLLIGLQVNIPGLIGSWQANFWAILGVLVARILVVYSLSWINNHTGREPIPLSWQHVLTWGGLRGALSLALALSLPGTLGPDRELLQAMAYGVVLFTLLVQAPTMRPLVKRLGIVTRGPAQIEYEMRQAELTASREAEAQLERRYLEGLLSAHSWEKIKPELQKQSHELAKTVRAVLQADPSLEEEELDDARREIQRAKRSTYLGLRRDGLISDEAYDRLIEEADAILILKKEEPTGVDGSEMGEEADEGLEENLELREIIVEPGSMVEGRRVRHVPWPDDFVIARIQRNSESIFPRGNTQLLAGDRLVAVASEESFLEALELCRPRNHSG
ncbi:MAG TPA: Na+/H+ antiporter [Anaerolineaceae bacterium]|nr:Na+/H+ antiporter [Anaerolineaceae bacterium]